MSELDGIRELIELGVAPPPSAEIGPMRRTLRRLSLLAGKAHARHQQRINTELLVQLDRLRGRLDDLERQAAASGQSVHDLQHWNHELADRAADLERRLDPVEHHIAASRALPGMTDFSLERLDAGSAGIALGYSGGITVVDEDSSYLRFENTFRGSEELIRTRQQVYLPILEGCDPVLDIGCGRGEMLELLRDARIRARGIDVDAAMVDHCHEKGLDDVELADATVHLRGIDDRSLGAIVALQVIEHLPYSQLVDLIRQSRRTLRPGGKLILETVNPHAPQALKTFWVDLSHCHPVFPEVTIALCRLAGFPRAFVFHPGGRGDAELDRFEIGDYAVVAELSRTAPGSPPIETSAGDQT